MKLTSLRWGVLLLCVACSSNSSNVDGGPTAAAACADEAMAVCGLRSTCSTGFNITKNFPDEATCTTRSTTTCVAASAASGTGQTPALIEACASAYPSESCTDYFDGNPIAACVPPAGTRAAGAACGASAECASTYCALAQYTVCGTCGPLPVAGASCQVAGDCGRDLACPMPAGATTGTCTAFAASGAACLTGMQPCAAGLSCVGEVVATSTMGACAAAGATIGAACDGSRKTAASCDPDLGLTCIPTAKGSTVGTCQAITLVAAGMTCGQIGSAPITGIADCIAGGLCIKAATTDTTGTCVAAAADGAPCNSDPTIGPPCLAPAKCVAVSTGTTAGTCTLPDPTTCM